ncbi:MAG: DUF2461 family protein [Bdellovibrionaceae bacterium]|nr:DUF2461 family protein [Pseudobdellovibrionaceae bacterium]
MGRTHMAFTKDTFKYFDLAKKNRSKREWFDKNKDLYETAVKTPMSELILAMAHAHQRNLMRIDVSGSKISRPLRAKNKIEADGAIVKTLSYFSLAEKQTSMFEWNPGIYFQVGSDDDDIFFGVGLYMISSRQISLLRNALVDDFETIDEIISDRKLKNAWGHLKGDVYKRFPKGYDPSSEPAKYLKYKQFYFSKQYTRKQLLDPRFTQHMVKDLGVIIEFFSWVRKTVGTYRK